MIIMRPTSCLSGQHNETTDHTINDSYPFTDLCDDVTKGTGSGHILRYGYQRFSCGYCDARCVYSAIEILFVIGIIANIIVIIRVIRDRKLHDPTFVAIAALAVADMLFLALNLTTAIERVILAITCTPPILISKPYYVLKSIFWIGANSHVALLAVLRYMTLAYPLRSNAYLSPKKVIVFSVCVWILGIVLMGTLSLLINIGLILPGRSEEFVIIQWITVYLLPLIVTTVLHILKICLVKRSTKQTATKATRKSIERMSKIVIVVIVMGALLPLPRLISKCLKIAGPNAYPSREFRTHVEGVSQLLFLINNFINPFIYGFLSQKFRQSIKVMFSCFHGQNEDSVATTDTPLSARKRNINLQSMPRKYSVDSLGSI